MSTAPKRAREANSGKASDAWLVRQCLKGNETAWSNLVEKYKNLIFSIPIRYGFSQEDAADIFQSVCMELLAEMSSLREPQALAAWLIQVTRHKCFRRQQEQRRQQQQEVEGDELPEPADETGTLVTQLQQEQAVRQALAALSPRCRQLIQLLFFESPARPYEEVARDLRLAQGSIGFIRKRCLEKLRQQLTRMGVQ